MRELNVGIDIGSISVKIVAVDADRTILREVYERHQGRPNEVFLARMEEVLRELQRTAGGRLAFTGTGGKPLAGLLGAAAVNEIIAQARATWEFHPDVRTIIEIGGEDSKLIMLETSETGKHQVQDFAMNTMCAAGTRSFLDQQASRLGLAIEELGDLALRSKTPPRMAGRCSVFAKSDMIHLQQQATPDYDIVAGLCFAMARNFKGNLGKGKELAKPISFQGGVAANQGLVRAFRVVLEAADGELIIPEHFATMGALGAIFHAMDTDAGAVKSFDLDRLRAKLQEAKSVGHVMPALRFQGDPSTRHYIRSGINAEGKARPHRVYLGVDVGSISTNVVALDEDGRLVSKSYLMTAGRPIEAVRNGLSEVGAELPKDVEVLGVCTTGSGRYLTGDFVGADVVRNEITAQATGALAIDPEVDTIFEIGGQDSKYISLDNGVVVDFEMNHACAAGTGSFLEEQAERLGISIKEEFGKLALASSRPVKLGERCTVFMETDLLHHQYEGANLDQLVGGLSYSIVLNYLNRVVGTRRVGNRIFFQGGVAANRGVVAAFEQVTGKLMFVPEHHEVTGAIGSALLAREERLLSGGAKPSRFRGFDLTHRKYEIESFECEDCPNHCEIKRVQIEGEDPLFYGSRCDKHNLKGKKGRKGAGVPDLFTERHRHLTADYGTKRPEHPKGKVGIPLALFQYDLLPFWKAYFEALGYAVETSRRTDKAIIRLGVERVAAQTCFPVKVAHGHVEELLASDVDAIFLPSIVSMEKDVPGQETNYLCPYVQTIPYQVRAVFSGGELAKPLWTPYFHYELGERDFIDFATATLGATRAKARRAVAVARHALREFRRRCIAQGEEAVAAIPAGARAVVLISRPYNGCDPGANLDLAKKLREMGVTVLPMDFLSTTGAHLGEDWDNMFWKYGQRIVRAAQIIRDDPRLYAIYVSNFSCGPDSFLGTFFKELMTGKPALVLEIDEHSADAGVITRLEAFFDSVRNARTPEQKGGRVFPASSTNGMYRTLYVPHMCEHAHALAAAFRSCGLPAEALPDSDEESLLIGRRYTTGKECLPAIVTTGDMVKKTMEKGFDPAKSAFFMPSGSGPCRFGQYNKLHRLVLKKIGMGEVPVYAPNQGRQFYEDFKTLAKDPTRVAWQGLCAVDLFYKALHAIRPYEKNLGETDRVFQEVIAELCRDIESQRSVPAEMRKYAQAFRSIPRTDGPPKPLVGVVGEIYVRTHPFSNNNVVADLEALGCEVDLALFGEWLYYTNWTRIREGKRTRAPIYAFKNWLRHTVQRAEERRLARPFHDIVRQPVETRTEDVVRLGNRYIHDTFEGEAILTIGRALELYHEGAAGIVNVMPFTCMPGTIVSGIFDRLRTEHDNLPVLSIAYDGQREGSYGTRLEAFVHQVREYHERQLAGAAH
ncbi:MAG: acyl-CoA dehydratase activase [Planctomycetota bacterium]